MHSVSLSILPCGSSFLNGPMRSSGVQSLIFPIATLVAFGVQTPMQVTLLWHDTWPVSLTPTKGALGGTMDKKKLDWSKKTLSAKLVSLILWGSRRKTT